MVSQRSRPRPRQQPRPAGLTRRHDPRTCAWAWAAAPSASLPTGRQLLLLAAEPGAGRGCAPSVTLGPSAGGADRGADTHSQFSPASLLPSLECPGVKVRVGRGPAPLLGSGGACSWALPSQAPTVLPTIHWEAASPPCPCQLFPQPPPEPLDHVCSPSSPGQPDRGWAVRSGPMQRQGPGHRGPQSRVPETRLPGRQSWTGPPSSGRLQASPRPPTTVGPLSRRRSGPQASAWTGTRTRSTDAGSW